jgi:ribosomal-protein-alanine N-acetyltransferase
MRWWDIQACAVLERELFPHDAWTETMFWSELAGVPGSRHYVVAERGDDVVGYAGLAVVAPDADVQTVAVAGPERGTGLGSRLLDDLLAEAALRGCSAVFLEVHVDNVAAVRLYERRGFVSVSRRRDYYGPGADALLMRRR